MSEPQWDLYEEPTGSLRTILANVMIHDVALALAIETPGDDVWLIEQCAGTRWHYRVGHSSIRVRRIKGIWVLTGSSAKWPRNVRCVRIELVVPLSAFHEAESGWLALAPANAGDSPGTLSWIDQQGNVNQTLALPPLEEMLDSGPTWYAPTD